MGTSRDTMGVGTAWGHRGGCKGHHRDPHPASRPRPSLSPAHSHLCPAHSHLCPPLQAPPLTRTARFCPSDVQSGGVGLSAVGVANPPLKRRRTPRGWGPPRRGVALLTAAVCPRPISARRSGHAHIWTAATAAAAAERPTERRRARGRDRTNGRGHTKRRGQTEGRGPPPDPREDPTRDSAHKPTLNPPQQGAGIEA